jgi:hypothetical protein
VTNPQQDAQPPNNTEAQPAEHQSDPEAAGARQRRLGEEASRIAQETGRNPVEVLRELDAQNPERDSNEQRLRLIARARLMLEDRDLELPPRRRAMLEQLMADRSLSTELAELVEVLEEAQGERQASADESEDELDLDNRRPPVREATGCLILPPGQSPQQPWFGVIEEQRTEADETGPGPKTIEERRARAAEECRAQRNNETQEYGDQGRGGGR